MVIESSTRNARDLRAFERQIVHEPLRIDDEANDGTRDFARIDGATDADRHDCDRPEFADRQRLDALVGAGHEIGLVLTQPDRPAGRGLKLLASAVKKTAQKQSLLVEQPPSVKGPEIVARLEAVNADVMIGDVNLAKSLIAAGLAREYYGEEKKSWCE